MDEIDESQIPSSVYRLQLNQDLPIQKAITLLPYLKELGVEGVYCSPYFQAHSAHGYDVTNPNAFNPLLGSLEEFKAFCLALQKEGLKQIADVVPNHMGIKGGENQWWQDVLENGPYSAFACFFAINWSPEKRELQDKVLLPILKTTYGQALQSQEITLTYQEGHFVIHYADYSLPVAPHTYALILEKLAPEIPEAKKEAFESLLDLYRLFPVALQERAIKKEEGKKLLLELFEEGEVRRALKKVLQLYKGKRRDPTSFTLLDHLLEAQFYRLSFWRVASHEINYRRFFNIHELVSIHIEQEKVLEMHHHWLFELIRQGHIQGLRIDHPDGLYDPVHYFSRLRERFALLTVVEKILDRKERLPEEWKVEGTVGYEYLNVLNGLFIRRENEKAFTAIYEAFIGHKLVYEEIVYHSKKRFSSYEMVSEVEALGLKLDRISDSNWQYRDFTRHELTLALAEVIACFPVYRTYINSDGVVNKRDSRYISIAIENAKKRAPHLDTSIFDFLHHLLHLKIQVDPEEKGRYLEFVLQFQQLTGPIMAKGLEDTTFYIYNRFLSLNEVGGDPPHFGRPVEDFHRMNLEKREKWPYGFLATSTHDTKRSEDIRMRLNVLSEMPDQWRSEVQKWAEINHPYKKEGLPRANTEYFIYQTLLGIWPQEKIGKEEYPLFVERVWQIILKSLREAKQETSWLSPSITYEDQIRAFLFAILENSRENPFLDLFQPFCQLIHACGALNSFSMLVLKMGSAGIVDLFQGNEMLTYRFVDPDNRSPIDFEGFQKNLASLKKSSPAALFAEKKWSLLKLALTTKALHFRRQFPHLFLKGEYIPLKVRGLRKEHLIAFMRKEGEQFVIILAGRFFSQFGDPPAWGDTEVLLPPGWDTKTVTDLFSEQKIEVRKRGSTHSLRVSEVFHALTVGFLYGP